MKNRYIILTSVLMFLSSCGYTRLADLNMVSNRNIDQGSEYKLIKKDVEGKAPVNKQDPLECAIDEAVKKADGEFMMNVKIYIKKSGSKIKVVGDVWGKKL